MAKPRAILKRRKAVQNIAKITKTMQMIATARFKKAFDRAVAARPYTDRLASLVSALSEAAGDSFTHPLLAAREPKRVVLLALASNRGLCGGYNSGVARHAVEALRAAKARGAEVELVVAGRKLASALKFQGAVASHVHVHFEDKPTFAQVDAVATPLLEQYSQGKIDEVLVAYTKFESSSRQRPTVERVLPLSMGSPPAGPAAGKAPAKGAAQDPVQGHAKGRRHVWTFDPDAQTILVDLLPRTVKVRVFQAFLDAAVSEQVARMTAMKSATDNAHDMIRDLGRIYNRSRQSQITTELTEIMGGAAALE